MKKVFMFVALLCCMISGFAEEKAIKLSKDKKPQGRTIVELPTASIDGQVLAIEFSEAAASHIVVVCQRTQVVVYSGSFATAQVIINQPSLPEGEFRLEITKGNETYIGDFEIQ